MSYVIRKKNGEKLIVLADQEVNGDYGVTFIGRKVNSYGEIQQDNLLWLMEHFAGATAPNNPVIGQIWYNSTSGTLNVCTKSSISGTGDSDTWVKLLQNASSDTEPDSTYLVNGDMWYDSRNKVLKVYDTNIDDWQIVGPTLKANQFLYKDNGENNTTDGTQEKTMQVITSAVDIKGTVGFKATILARSSTTPKELSAMWELNGLIYVDPTAPASETITKLGEVDMRRRCSNEERIFNEEDLNWRVTFTGGQVNPSGDVVISFKVGGKDGANDVDAHVCWTINMELFTNN